MNVPFEPTSTYKQKEDEIRAFVQDYFEEHGDCLDYMEIGELFGIRLDDLEEIEHLIRRYDSEGAYLI